MRAERFGLAKPSVPKDVVAPASDRPSPALRSAFPDLGDLARDAVVGNEET